MSASISSGSSVDENVFFMQTAVLRGVLTERREAWDNTALPAYGCTPLCTYVSIYPAGRRSRTQSSTIGQQKYKQEATEDNTPSSW